MLEVVVVDWEDVTSSIAAADVNNEDIFSVLQLLLGGCDQLLGSVAVDTRFLARWCVRAGEIGMIVPRAGL